MSQLFEQVITVEEKHLDALGHVNNVVYMSWMQDVALAHSTALGLGMNEYLTFNHAMVASEHHVKYRKPCFAGDELILRTWLGELTAFATTRHYLFYRKQDRTVVFQAQSLFVCVELSSGKIKRLSPTFIHAYQPLDRHLDPTLFESI